MPQARSGGPYQVAKKRQTLSGPMSKSSSTTRRSHDAAAHTSTDYPPYTLQGAQRGTVARPVRRAVAARDPVGGRVAAVGR
jgi:hypothetical protein